MPQRTPEQRAKHAEYMRKYYEVHPGYKARADKEHRRRYIERLRSYDRWRSQTPERKAQKLASQRKRYAEKREEIKVYQKEYCRNNKEKRDATARRRIERLKQAGTWQTLTREYGMRHRHGLTLEQYDQMLAAQGGVCAICGDPPTVGFNKRLHIDHDHKTGVKRGLLCMHCNHSLERLEKYPDWAEKATAYLKRPR